MTVPAACAIAVVVCGLIGGFIAERRSDNRRLREFQEIQAKIQEEYQQRAMDKWLEMHQERPKEQVMRVPLEFCRWLHQNFDELIAEHRDELIAQAHIDAAKEKAMGTPEERKHKVFGSHENAKGAGL